MHFKILEIHFLEEKSGKNPANFFGTGPEPEPDIEAGYPAVTGFSRISGRFLTGISTGKSRWNRIVGWERETALT